jgi:V/A-type H+/Na+-transporting ATPase subunit E
LLAAEPQWVTSIEGVNHMADAKLQDLIETLKKHGVESGEEASRQIIEQAQGEASEILARARSEAEGIVKAAKEEAEKRMRQLHSSMEIAASQFLTSLKGQIEKNFLSLPLQEKLNESLGDTSFLKELLSTCVREYLKGAGRSDLVVLVSKDQRDKLGDFAAELTSGMGKGAEGSTLKLQTDGVSFGFLIGKTDGSVTLDFTSEAFLDLFLKYLSPRFHEFFRTLESRNSEKK